MNTTTQRVERYRRAQTAAGKRLLTTYVSPEALRQLRALSRGGRIGAVIERLLLGTRQS